LALAEPEPFTLANRITKSFTPEIFIVFALPLL
jgi:hypothetical protein